jgi:secreted trypsin-like serine protease
MKIYHIFVVLLSVLISALIVTGGSLAQTPAPNPRDSVEPSSIPTPEPLIVGGTIASPGEYPWMAALVSASISNPYSGQYCGASLIAPRWVLTAAHCVYKSGKVISPSSLDVVVGINNLSDGPTSGTSGQRLDVVQVIPYPGYNFATDDGDVALLKLATPAQLNATVKTIQLVTSNQDALFAPGVSATVTGWGSTSYPGVSYPNELREVTVPIVSNTTCNQSYGGAITANMLCAGLSEGGEDSCYGDSGGPLIVPDGSTGWLQAGVVNWGYGCALSSYYGVYARVSQFEAWIRSQVFHAIAFAYLPVVLNNPSSTPGCTPSPAGDTDNTSDALVVCSGQTILRQVNDLGDQDDVFKIQVNSGQHLSLILSGSGGDADLYLYPPGTLDVNTDPWAARSSTAGNDESINFSANASGYWYVEVFACSGMTSYDLVVTVSG